MKCQTINCNSDSKVWVSKGGVAKRVCWKCEEHLVTLYGWVTLPSRQRPLLPPKGGGTSKKM